jgi:predicted O-methyltransferase YrrM
MDRKVEAVMAEYQARADAESKLMRERPPAEIVGHVDDFLLPVGPATASLMSTLIKESKARSILEIGGSYGYSTVWLAEAARATGGKLTTLELHPGKVEYSRSQMAKAGLEDFVDYRLGDALETLEALEGPFEFVLIDLWKHFYVTTFGLVHPKLADGALIVADNMLYPEDARVHANAYRERVRAAQHMTSVLLPVGSGIELSRYR